MNPEYRDDQYGSVYQLQKLETGDVYVFIGKLNGRSLDEFLDDMRCNDEDAFENLGAYGY